MTISNIHILFVSIVFIGFTVTSVWVDQMNIFPILLTNTSITKQASNQNWLTNQKTTAYAAPGDC